MSKKKVNEIYLVSSPINPTTNDGYFDDCPICQAMREAEKQGRSLSEEEAKEAFRKAKDI